jgi:anti-sigma B factor antagonist
LSLDGELDLACIDQLDKAIRDALQPAGPQLILVDMTHVTFADSAVLRWLVRADAWARRSGARLVVHVAPGPVRRVLAISGVDQRLSVLEAR